MKIIQSLIEKIFIYFTPENFVWHDFKFLDKHCVYTVFCAKKKIIELDRLDFSINSINYKHILYTKNKKTEHEII